MATDDPSTPADADPGAAGDEASATGSTAKGTRRSPLDADGMERPAFLLDFPEDPELEPLISAFEAGNYAFVRQNAPALAGRTESASVRDAALELRRRIDPDPLARYLLLISIGLLLFLVVWAYGVDAH